MILIYLIILIIPLNLIKRHKLLYLQIYFLGIGDWGLGIGPNPKSTIPNPQQLLLKNN